MYVKRRLYSEDYSPWGIGIVALIALIYTTPWDSYMIKKGAWSYGEGVAVARLWEVPLGEYLFFVIQPLITGAWLYVVLSQLGTRDSGRWVYRWILTAAAFGMTAVGGYWAWVSGGQTFYIGMILFWVGPVLALQWAYGGHYILRNLRIVLVSVLPPALYLASADRFAIENGLWTISKDLTTGIMVLGLPVEEGAFFVFTCLLVVQGVMLFRWTLDEWQVWANEYDIPMLRRLAGRGPSG